MSSAKRLVTAAAAIFLVSSHQAAAAPQTKAFGLSPEAAQVASQIGVSPLLERLERLRSDKAAAPLSVESLLLRQEITEKVLSASLDIDSVNAIIDAEVEQIGSIRSDLQAKRDRAQNIINVASIFAGGALGAANTALQFKSSTQTLGNGIGVASRAASVLLSVIGIHKQGGGRRPLSDSPRMLARFFGRLPDAAEVIPGVYPEAVWSYLASASPSQPQKGTRREQLIVKWRTEGRIGPESSPKDRRIEFLSGSIAHAPRLNIDELTDSVTMLLDVRAMVSLMKRELSEILRGLSLADGNQ